MRWAVKQLDIILWSLTLIGCCGAYSAVQSFRPKPRLVEEYDKHREVLWGALRRSSVLWPLRITSPKLRGVVFSGPRWGAGSWRVGDGYGVPGDIVERLVIVNAPHPKILSSIAWTTS